jgi:hypothetical protein
MKSWIRQLRHSRDLGTTTDLNLLLDARTTTYVVMSMIEGINHVGARMTVTGMIGPIQGY